QTRRRKCAEPANLSRILKKLVQWARTPDLEWSVDAWARRRYKFTEEPDMENTRTSLLGRACEGEESAWRRVVELYQPLIRGWLLRQQVAAQEVEDLTQDVLAVLVKQLPRFEHAGRPGAFRAWLRTVTVNRARAYWRAGSARAAAAQTAVAQ